MAASSALTRGHPAIVAGGIVAVLLVSAAGLPWPVAAASTTLGARMIGAADVDARTCLVPDVVTFGAIVCGILAAPALEPLDPWPAAAAAAGRAVTAALVLALVRRAYASLRHREGLGFGDVKLAAAVGAWLPLDAI